MVDRGITGIVDTIAPGVRPGSDTSHMALLGYDPKTQYTGRGPIEAAGVGLKLRAGDLAFRANFATLDKQSQIIDRRAGRITDVSGFETALNSIKLKNIQMTFRAGTAHRGALVLRPDKTIHLSDKISSNDPKAENVRVKDVAPLDSSKEAKVTAQIVNDFLTQARTILENHPLNKNRVKQKLLSANSLLVRGPGFTPVLVPFETKHGLKGACVAGAAMYKGVSTLVGLDVIPVKGATGKVDTNVEAKTTAVLQALEKYDFVFMHVKATDSLAEDGDAAGKTAFIEKIDAALPKLVAREDTVIVVTADHTTSSELKRHTGDPVPILFYGPGVRRDAVRKFGERECAKGDVGRIRGLDVMSEAINLAGRAPMYGT